MCCIEKFWEIYRVYKLDFYNLIDISEKLIQLLFLQLS